MPASLLQTEPPAREVVAQRIDALQADPDVSLSLAVVAGAAGAAAATVLVGGTTRDLLPAFLVNLGVQLVWRVLGRTRLPAFLPVFAGGSAAVVIAQLLRAWWPDLHAGLVVAGGIMTLVPGVAFTSFIQDALYGDLASAATQGLDAVVKASGLALGATAGLVAVQGFLPIQVAMVGWVPLSTSTGFAVLLSLGSAVGARVEPRAWLPGAFSGGLAWWAYVYLIERVDRFDLATFGAAAALGVVASLLARAYRLPVPNFVVPGFIPLVPGVTVYRAILSMVQGDTAGSLRLFADALLAAGAIAGGIAAGTALVQGLRRSLD